ncbi:MAG: DivIVA domain-containing protein [Eubacterium sp.]|nr:DivIVA domain-containing protein [Eubacterium sp.]
MISANDLRNVELREEENGFSREEVKAVIVQAADTIEAYASENKELYGKLKYLADKIEEYRSEEDSIKTALITAQKMADKIEAEAKEKAETLTAESEAAADEKIRDADAKAEQLVSEARDYASQLINEKTAESESIIADAEKKANEAIGSAKIIAGDILAQAKSIAKELIAASKEEKEAYELLAAALKKDATEFIGSLKALYGEQLDALNAAKLDSDGKRDDEDVTEIEGRISSLLNEIDEIDESIPEEAPIVAAPIEDEPVYKTPEEDEPVYEAEKTDEAPAREEIIEADFTEIADEAEEEDDNGGQLTLTEEVPQAEPAQDEEPVGEEPEENEEPADPMEAVEAFSRGSAASEKDGSLFDDNGEQPFESYFKVKREDAHLDKTQTISLVPPDDFESDEDDADEGHRHFFKKKK